MQILLVEDDPDIVSILREKLESLGFSLIHKADGRAGLEAALSGNFSLILLDVMLPEMEGMEVCRQLREKQIDVPIMIITAKSEEIDIVMGLEMGADDYITKPFKIREVAARVKAHIRRNQLSHEATDQKSDEMIIGPFAIDCSLRRAKLDGSNLELTPLEYDLLVFLAKNRGKSYRRSELLKAVWGYEASGYEATVSSHINRLRSKIEEDPTSPKYLVTVRGFGYRFLE